MAQTSLEVPSEFDMEDVVAELEAYMETLVTEDDEPMDNQFSDYQRRLLVESLRNSWRPLDEDGAPRKFLAGTDVAVYWAVGRQPLAPDVFLSLDVELEIENPSDWWRTKNRSYFVWMHGKAPEVAIEIVSNDKGKETGSKLRDYALIGVPYYVIFDPGKFLGEDALRIFKLDVRRYVAYHESYFPEVGLGVTLWEGSYEDSKPSLWLRWRDAQGNLILTGAERAALLAAKLRELGVDPDQILSGQQ
jgi:Uma2 family endonuclease